MSKIINFCKPVYADLIAGRLLLHPILLTAAFLVASSGAFWLIDDVIFGRGYGWDFVGEGIFFMFCSFAIDAYFLTFCSYLLFRAYFTRRHKFIWLGLGVFILISCIYGYLSAHIDHQKEGVLACFFAASLIAICIYILLAAFAAKSFWPIVYAVIYPVSFFAAVWLIFRTQGYYILEILQTLCPLAWAFHFKVKFKQEQTRQYEKQNLSR